MGPNPKVTKKVQLRITKAISNLHDSRKKNAVPCNLYISIRTVQRHLKTTQYEYKRATTIISLTKVHNAKKSSCRN